jgi:ketosteroid isomerase-like protein
MKVALLGVVVAACGGGARPVAPVSSSSSGACSPGIEACATFEEFLAAFIRRDWDAFRATFADDITVMFDSDARPERRDGRAAVEEMFRFVFPPAGSQAELPPPIEPDNLRFQDLGDSAVISFHVRSPDEIGRRTIVLHKTATGWRVVHIHGSSFALSPATP